MLLYSIAEDVMDLVGSAHAIERSSAQKNILLYLCMPPDALL